MVVAALVALVAILAMVAQELAGQVEMAAILIAVFNMPMAVVVVWVFLAKEPLELTVQDSADPVKAAVAALMAATLTFLGM